MLLARAFLVTLAIGILLAPLAADAQQAGKVHRIGFLSGVSPSTLPQNLDAFRQGLRELGWVEGQNIAIEYRWAEGEYERLPHLAADLVHVKVDLIVAPATPAALAAKNATRTIPIVFMAVGDPVGVGLVASLARPGGNVTGASLEVTAETYGKRLQLLMEVMPKVRRVAVLWNAANPWHGPRVKEMEVFAQVLRMELHHVGVSRPDEFDSAFSAMTRERADALLVLADSMFVLHRTRIADLAAKTRLPAMYAVIGHAEAGGLMAYGSSLPPMFRRAATYVDKILKGAKPADLPVEQPTKFELVINLKTAKALGLKIPPSILIRADKVIE